MTCSRPGEKHPMPRISRRGVLGHLGVLSAAAAFPGAGWAAASDKWPAGAIARGAAGYEDARQAAIWAELKPPRFPGAIAQPSSLRDIVGLVDFARNSGKTISVRGSGHNYFASFLQDDSILLDVSGLNQIRLQGDVAYIEAGVQSGPFAMALQEQGRAFPTAHNADVGMSGFLLGGGMGWNGEDWGQFACFQVQSLDVVTADGTRIVVNETSHPDLFWAARGGGMYFPGVVVGFQVKTFPYPKGLMGSHYIYSGERARELCEWLAPIGEAGHRNLETFLGFGSTVETDASGKSTRREQCKVYALAYGDDARQSRELLDILAGTAPKDPISRAEFNPMGFADFYGESITGPAMRVYNDSLWSDDPIAVGIILGEFHQRAPSPESISILDFRSSPKLPTGAPMRAGRSYVTTGAQWHSPADDAVNARWMEDLTAALKPVTTGCYLNETDIFARRDRLAYCFTPEAVERLRAVQEKYDPRGVFTTLVPL